MKPTDMNANPVLIFLTNKRWAFVRHILFILVVALSFDVLTPESMRKYAEKFGVPFEIFYMIQVGDMTCSLALIYFNLYFLFPRYFQKGLYTHYLIGIFILATIFFIMGYFTQQYYIEYLSELEQFAIHITLEDYIAMIMFPLVFICATTGYKVFKVWIYDQERFMNIEKEKLNSELTNLKNQVNPHFLFNTLNNLHVLIQADPDKASELVLGLSDVLRFQIYNSQNDKVLLKKDIDIINQYLELEKIRRDDLKFSINIINNINDVFVPPLLFTNFIDNAIKHSQSRDSAFIKILFERVGNHICFEITNSKPDLPAQIGNEGLGLVNVKKRLELLYGATHTLEIKEEKTLFSVKLIFPI